jgi:hypothetical protein
MMDLHSMLATHTSYLYPNYGRPVQSGPQAGCNAFHMSNMPCLDLNQKQSPVNYRKPIPIVRNSIAIFPIYCRIM